MISNLWLSEPPAAYIASIHDAAVLSLGVVEEVEAYLRESVEFFGEVTHTLQDDERARHVIDAVPVLDARPTPLAVLKDAAVVADRKQMLEIHVGLRWHAAALPTRGAACR